MDNLNFIAIAIGIVLYVFAFLVLKSYLFIYLLKKRKNTLGIIAVIVTSAFYFVGVLAYCAAMAQIRKEKDKIYTKVTLSPSDLLADELIACIEKYGYENKPNEWNKLRSVWITLNESSNVSTEKKKQLKQFLMLQGLTMHYKDAQIIDNCKL